MQEGALLSLAVKGILIAGLPLVYVWRSRAPDKIRKLAWVTAFLTLDLIVFGGFTRLTDSGLGCPDWPGCYGHSNPLSAGESIRAAETAQPTGPVTMGKAWIEMLHRYFAMAIGVLIIVLLALSVLRWRRERSRSLALPITLLVWVCVQGAFGAWTVTQKLQPIFVTAHLLGGMLLLALLVWFALRESPQQAGDDVAALRGAAALALVALVVQVALGGWVSSNYAVMACPDFPLCQGTLAPAGMDFANGFTLWRELGRTGGEAAQAIPFEALIAIHWVHRWFAVVAAAVIGWLAWRARTHSSTRRASGWLGALLLLQMLTGMSNVVFQWPLALAVLHNGGAAALVAIVFTVNYRAFTVASRPVASPGRAEAGVAG